jgi:branched-chain amino acid transport system permease protein
VLWLTNNLLRSKIGGLFSPYGRMIALRQPWELRFFHTSSLPLPSVLFLPGLAGALFAYVTQTITPGLFNLTLSIEFLAVIILGGLGSISGSIMGAVAIVF